MYRTSDIFAYVHERSAMSLHLLVFHYYIYIIYMLRFKLHYPIDAQVLPNLY